MTAPVELVADGPRVRVRTIRPADGPAYSRAVRLSLERLAVWNPVDPDDLARHLAAQGPDYRTFLVLARDPVPEQPVAGKINVTGVTRGRFRSGVLGYDSYDPYAGRGLFAQGLRLVVGLALASGPDGGMDLHRVEANVQPGNVRSAAVLRSLGFRHEGSTPRMLWLPDAAGRHAWRDHERYAITREEWPATAYAQASRRRTVVWLTGVTGPVEHDAAARLAVEVGLPVLPATLADLTSVLAGCPAGALVTVGEEAVGPLTADLALPGPDHAVVSLPERASALGVDAGAAWSDRQVVRLALELRARTS